MRLGPQGGARGREVCLFWASVPERRVCKSGCPCSAAAATAPAVGEGGGRGGSWEERRKGDSLSQQAGHVLASAGHRPKQVLDDPIVGCVSVFPYQQVSMYEIRTVLRSLGRRCGERRGLGGGRGCPQAGVESGCMGLGGVSRTMDRPLCAVTSSRCHALSTGCGPGSCQGSGAAAWRRQRMTERPAESDSSHSVETYRVDDGRWLGRQRTAAMLH